MRGISRIYWGILLIFLCPVWKTNAASFSGFRQPEMKAVYNKPAKVWESEALPIGNGYMGAMIFGDVYRDVIQVNEHSLWSGGPGENPDYDGGHLGTPAENRANLQKVRRALQQKMNEFSKNDAAHFDSAGKLITKNYGDENRDGIKPLIESLRGTKNNFGSYQTLGNIEIAYNSLVIPDVIRFDSDCDNINNYDQRVDKLFDANNNTKWYADKGFQGKFPCYIAWEYGTKLRVKSYSLTSGNDVPGRDPVSWNFYGSNDGKRYELLDKQSNVTFEKRKRSFKISRKRGNYKFLLKLRRSRRITRLHLRRLPDIELEYEQLYEPLEPYSDYVLMLDIDNAVHSVIYKENGTTFTRECFMSYPDNVMVMRLKADMGDVFPGRLGLHLLSRKKEYLRPVIL